MSKSVHVTFNVLNGKPFSTFVETIRTLKAGFLQKSLDADNPHTARAYSDAFDALEAALLTLDYEADPGGG
jgi:hypothetical protein